MLSLFVIPAPKLLNFPIAKTNCTSMHLALVAKLRRSRLMADGRNESSLANSGLLCSSSTHTGWDYRHTAASCAFEASWKSLVKPEKNTQNCPCLLIAITKEIRRKNYDFVWHLGMNGYHVKGMMTILCLTNAATLIGFHINFFVVFNIYSSIHKYKHKNFRKFVFLNIFVMVLVFCVLCLVYYKLITIICTTWR